MSDLETAIADFGVYYKLAKTYTTTKDRLQKRMFEAFDATFSDEQLPRRSVVVPEGRDITDHCAKHHPGWIIESIQDRQVILKENPSLMAYVHPTPVNGLIYGREQYEGSPSLDDELLKTENPALWERVTTWPEPWYTLARDLMAKYTPERYNDIDAMVDEFFTEREIPRMLKAPSEWSDADMGLLEDYIVPAPMKVRLKTPREPKEDNE